MGHASRFGHAFAKSQIAAGTGLPQSGAVLITGPGLVTGRIDPRGLLCAVPGPLIYAFYLTVTARLMGRRYSSASGWLRNVDERLRTKGLRRAAESAGSACSA